MNIYKIVFTPKTIFGSKLESDNLAGQIFWAIRYVYGEPYLEKVLEKFNKGKPPFLISSAFPEDLFPRPFIVPKEVVYDEAKSKEETRKNRERAKKQKKGDYVLFSDILKYQENFNSIEFSVDNDLIKTQKINEVTVIRNSIDRKSFIVNEENGQIWDEEYLWIGSDEESEITDEKKDINKKMVSYLKIVNENIDDNEEKLNRNSFEKILKYLEGTGLGKDKSIGKGHFKIELKDINDEEKKLFNFKNGNAFISISNCWWKEAEVIGYQLFNRYGKVGEEFSTTGRFLKKPVIFYKHGSIFKIDNKKVGDSNKVDGSKMEEIFYGKMIDGIYSGIEGKNIVQYGYAFPVYINYKL